MKPFPQSNDIYPYTIQPSHGGGWVVWDLSGRDTIEEWCPTYKYGEAIAKKRREDGLVDFQVS